MRYFKNLSSGIGQRGGIETYLLDVTVVIYNPILRVHGTREMWYLINLATIGLAVASIFALKHNKEEQ